MCDDAKGTEHECAVCLQKCHHPTQLPCGHIFCFLCVKGVAIQSHKCAMCRAEIPADYLDNPVLLEKLSPQQQNEELTTEYQWYYEGRNGWWKYDECSNEELEAAYNSGDAECRLLLAGSLYSINFQNMTQVKCNDHSRRRKVRRDTPLLPAKGIAGIKTDNAQTQPVKTENDVNSNRHSVVQNVDVTSNEDDDDDDDIQIVEIEPVVIEIDDISDDFQRLNESHVTSMMSSQAPQYSKSSFLNEHSYTRPYYGSHCDVNQTARPPKRVLARRVYSPY